MDKLYLYVNLFSISVPFLFTFHSRLNFHKKWYALFPAIAVMMLIFVTWDVFFAKAGIWGFNQEYLLGHYIFGLPIEEWFFFICIPYACLFLNHVLSVTHPQFILGGRTVNWIYLSLIIASVVLAFLNIEKWYTTVNFLYASLVLVIGLLWFKKELQRFSTTFIIVFFPFLIVNGILTGTGLENPIVWYNDNHNLGIRILSIPVEDTMYALTMLLTVLYVMSIIETKKNQPL